MRRIRHTIRRCNADRLEREAYARLLAGRLQSGAGQGSYSGSISGHPTSAGYIRRGADGRRSSALELSLAARRKSICVTLHLMSTSKYIRQSPPPKHYRDDYPHDLSLPIAVNPPIIKDTNTQAADQYHNDYLLRERQTHGRRTVLKLQWEVYARKAGKENNLHRLRNKHILLSLPNADQAELVMATVQRVVESMHGKLLVKSE